MQNFRSNLSTFWIFGNFLATFWHPSKQLSSILRSQLGRHILKAVVNPGPWTLDSRLWILDSGLTPLPASPKIELWTQGSPFCRNKFTLHHLLKVCRKRKGNNDFYGRTRIRDIVNC